MTNISEVGTDMKSNNISLKIANRIPIWAKRPNQYNHKILKSFFACENLSGVCTKQQLLNYLLNNYPNEMSESTIINNFNSMCTDAGNAQGKVFVFLQ